MKIHSMVRIGLALALGSSVSVTSVSADAREDPEHNIHHALLISVDGLHQVDTENFIKSHPRSTLVDLAKGGVTFTNAKAPTPSDSFPGLLALVSGGTPKSTGVYYDDSYDRTLFAPGSDCKGSPGSEIVYDEFVDHNVNELFSGGIDAVNLPLELTNTGQCKPVFPHQFLKVNTIFGARSMPHWCSRVTTPTSRRTT